MNTIGNFENSIANELAECVFSIKEPLDLSDDDKLLEQDQPLEDYFGQAAENPPLCVLYLDLEDSELVANDRHETSIAVDFSIIYRINPDESRSGGLEKGKKCLTQFVDNIKARQRNGTALTPFYLNDEAEITANTPNGIDYEKINPAIATATAKFTIREAQNVCI